MSDLLTYSRDDRVASITLDDGKVNALSIPMLREIHAALDQAEADGAVVALGGREGYLSAGFDLRVFREEPENLPEMLRLGATLCERLLSFPTPVVVACSGHAIAAGSFLLLAADARIGVEGPFKIGLNEVRIGLTMPLFVVELARHRLVPAHFDRAVISAVMYEPGDAVTAGLPRPRRRSRRSRRGPRGDDGGAGGTEPRGSRGDEAARPRRCPDGAPRGDRGRVSAGVLSAARRGDRSRRFGRPSEQEAEGGAVGVDRLDLHRRPVHPGE